MAMLAETRRKVRYNLTPRGKPLYDDDSRFGTKMLEKMGWSKGKGLGANEDGCKDFVHVRLRNTNEGLGYEDRNDHWTQHEQDFSGLLTTLNGASESNAKVEENGNSSEPEIPVKGLGFSTKPKQNIEKLKNKFSGESLEEKSKRSKVRVHYKKFTKGKDLSQYSEKDLANIFGKKVVEEQQENGIFEQFTAISVPKKDEKVEVEQNKEEELNAEQSSVNMINTGVSVNDYFRRKMEALRTKRQSKAGTTDTDVSNINSHNDMGPVGVAKREKNKKKHMDESEEVDEVPRKKKKKSKETTTVKLQDTFGNVEVKEVEAVTSKERNNFVSGPEAIEMSTLSGDIPRTKKKKSKESVTEKLQRPLGYIETEEVEAIPSKAKNKFVLQSEKVEVSTFSEVVPKKKKKKSKEITVEKLHDLDSNIGIEQMEPATCYADCLVAEETSLKKTKNKTGKAKNDINLVAITGESNAEMKKKYKRKNSIDCALVKGAEPALADNDKQQNTTKRKASKEGTNIQSIEDSITPNKHEKTKDSGDSSNYISVTEDQLSAAQSKKKSKKSAEDKLLTLDEIVLKCNSYNECTISSFVAEKFRKVNLASFPGSTLSNIPGYSFTEGEIKLNVLVMPKDEQRVTALWNCKINKYQSANPKAMYHKYIQSMKVARREKVKRPRFNVKTLRRKSVFQSI